MYNSLNTELFWINSDVDFEILCFRFLFVDEGMVNNLSLILQNLDTLKKKLKLRDIHW